MSHCDTLQEILESGSDEDCLAFFAGMSESERAKYAVQADAALSALSRYGILERSRKKVEYKRREAAAVTALAATASPEEMAARFAWLFRGDYSVLSHRPRTWVQRWVDLVVAGGSDRVTYVKPVVDLGLCDPPAHPNWPLGLVRLLVVDRVGSASTRREQLLQILREHPFIVEDHVWPCFEPSALEEEWPEHGRWFYQDAEIWGWALAGLSEAGMVARERLLDAPLQALARDAVPHAGPRFGPFHEALRPTLEERQARLTQYLLLLGCVARTTVGFAVKALAALDKAKLLPGDQLCEHIEPALRQKTKNIVGAALKLLAGAHGRENGLGQKVAVLATEALLHETTDIQRRVLELVAAIYPDAAVLPDEVREAIARYAELIQPSLQIEFAAWCSPHDVADDAAVTGGMAAEAITPIASADELTLELSAILANADDPVAVERVLDGVYRLSGEVVELKALYRQATKVLNAEAGNLRRAFAFLVIAWHDGESMEEPSWRDVEWPAALAVLHQHAALGDFVHLMFAEATAGLGKPRVRLCTPSNTRGQIEPAQLVERALVTEGEPIDQILSLCRLEQSGRTGEVRSRARKVGGEYGRALRYALGGSVTRGAKNRDLWLAAARARDPWGSDDTLHAKLGDDLPGGTRVGTCTFIKGDYYPCQSLVWQPPLPEKVRATRPVALLHNRRRLDYHTHEPIGHGADMVRFGAFVHPGNLEAYFGDGYQRLDVGWWEAQWYVRHYFEPMLFRDCVLGPNAHRLIAVGLTAKEAGQSGMAVDCAVVAIADGRLSAELLAQGMSELLQHGIAVPSRWARALGEVARVSREHRAAMLDATFGALRGDPASAPKGFANLLGFLHENCVAGNRAVTDEAARAFLEGLTTGGKTAKLKKALLAL